MKSHSFSKKILTTLILGGLFFAFPAVSFAEVLGTGPAAEATAINTGETALVTGASKISDAVSAQVQTAEANWTMFVKNGLDKVAYALGQAALNQVTENTVSWIRGGFHGSPSFALDMQQLLNDVADMVAGDLAQQVRDLAVCEFDVNFKIRLMNSLLLAPQEGSPKYARQALCPFNSADGKTPGEQITAFGENFAYGGWGFFENTMRDAGNEFGLALITRKEYDKRVTTHQQTQTQKLTESGGFLDLTDYSNPDSCNFPDEYRAREARGLVSPGEQTAARNQYCIIKTPGSVIANQVHDTFGVDMQRLGAQDSFNKIATAFIQQMGKTLITGLYKEANKATGQSESGLYQPQGFNPNDDACLNVDPQQLTSYESSQVAILVDKALNPDSQTGKISDEKRVLNELAADFDSASSTLNRPPPEAGLPTGSQPLLDLLVKIKTAKHLLEYEDALKNITRTDATDGEIGEAKTIIQFYQEGKDVEYSETQVQDPATNIITIVKNEVFSSLKSQGYIIPQTATSETFIVNPERRDALASEMGKLSAYLEGKKDVLIRYYETDAAIAQFNAQMRNNAIQQVTGARLLNNLSTCTKKAFYNTYNKEVDRLEGRSATSTESTSTSTPTIVVDRVVQEMARAEKITNPQSILDGDSASSEINLTANSQQITIQEGRGLQEYRVTYDNAKNVQQVFTENGVDTTQLAGSGILRWSGGSLKIDQDIMSSDIGAPHIESVYVETFDDNVYKASRVIQEKVATITIKRKNVPEPQRTTTWRVAEDMIEVATKQEFTIQQKPGNIPMQLILMNAETIRASLARQNIRFDDRTGEFLPAGGSAWIDFSGTANVLATRAYVNTYTSLSENGVPIRNVYMEVYFRDGSMQGFTMSNGKINRVIAQQMI